MLKRYRLFILLPALQVCAGSLTAVRAEDRRHLEIRNLFAKPEEVVRYFVERDSDGFVYSGLLDLERTEFTEWSQSPRAEIFYVARAFQIGKPSAPDAAGRVRIDVTYDLVRLQDGSGTSQTPRNQRREVHFVLRRTAAGPWRIMSPAAQDIVPVVIEKRLK